MSDAVALTPTFAVLPEAESAGFLQHPNVVTVYDFGEVDGHPFITERRALSLISLQAV